VRIVFKPLEDLAANAEQMADGNFEFPVESRSSREAIMLSRALTRIQGTLGTPQNMQTEGGGPSFRLLSGGADVTPIVDSNATDEQPDDTSQSPQTRRKS